MINCTKGKRDHVSYYNDKFYTKKCSNDVKYLHRLTCASKCHTRIYILSIFTILSINLIRNCVNIIQKMCNKSFCFDIDRRPIATTLKITVYLNKSCMLEISIIIIHCSRTLMVYRYRVEEMKKVITQFNPLDGHC